MSKSNIEWTEHTWNPIVGCSIVSPGCTNCYAMKMAARIEAMGNQPHYAGTTRKVNGNAVWTGKLAMAPDSALLAPLNRKKPTTYFVNSMGDLFHEDCPDEWIDRVFAVMALAPQHTFQVLTKRAARMRAYISAARAVPVGMEAMGLTLDAHARDANSSVGAGCVLTGDIAHLKVWPLPNIWLGISAERQREWDERKEYLRQTPATVRFASFEPLLGNIIEPQPISNYLQWAIVGGESGPDARPMHPDWALSLRDQCEVAGVPYFFKQWGNWLPGYYSQSRHTALLADADGPDCGITLGAPPHKASHIYNWPDDRIISINVGKKRAGRLLKGVEYNGMPCPQHSEVSGDR